MHRRHDILAFAPVIAALLGCSSQLASTPSDAPVDARPVTLEAVSGTEYLRFNSGITTRERIIVRTASSWEALWPQIVGSLRPIPPTPAIDFATKTVIVATMGSRNSGGYVITVDEVREARGNAWIAVSEKAPGTRCGTTGAITTPIAVVVVPRFDGSAAFSERTATVDC